MSESVTMIDLRNFIDEINRSIMRDRGSGEVANVEVLNRLRVEKAKEIEALTPQLVTAALIKLYNDVCNRRVGRVEHGINIDLFGNYYGIPKTLTIFKGRKKDISKVTIQEAELWIENHETRVDEKKNEVFKRLLEECRPYIFSQEDSLETVIKRKMEAEQLNFEK